MFRLKWDFLKVKEVPTDHFSFVQWFCWILFSITFAFSFCCVFEFVFLILVLIAYQTPLPLPFCISVWFHYLWSFVFAITNKKTYIWCCFLYKFSTLKTNEKLNDNKKKNINVWAGVGWNNTKQNIEQMECADLSFCAPFIRFFLLNSGFVVFVIFI